MNDTATTDDRLNVEQSGINALKAEARRASDELERLAVKREKLYRKLNISEDPQHSGLPQLIVQLNGEIQAAEAIALHLFRAADQGEAKIEQMLDEGP